MEEDMIAEKSADIHMAQWSCYFGQIGSEIYFILKMIMTYVLVSHDVNAGWHM